MSDDKIDRILYSQISINIFSFSDEDRGILYTNLDKLLNHTLDKGNGITEDISRIIFKLYDHLHLSICQIDNSIKIANKIIEKEKDSINNELKKNERDYITILGIFAAIVITFVSGMSFSTSVLQNIHKANIYRVLLTVILIGFVIFNTIYILFYFITRINGRELEFKSLARKVNLALLIMVFLIIVSWIVDIGSIRDYIFNYLPWKS